MNQQLDQFIHSSGFLAIDPVFGFDLLGNYYRELEQVKSGIPYKALGIGDRRAMSNVMVEEVRNETRGVDKMDKIAILNFNGLIQANDGMSSIGTARMAEQLVREKNNVIGAVMHINSGGGYLDGAELMGAGIQEFGKPVVTVSNYAASAAFYIASFSTEILAVSHFSSFGSIGVLFELNKQLREKYSEIIETVYADTSPDKNSQVRKWLKGDSSGFQELANEKDKMFMKTISENRMLVPSEMTSETLRGGMFHAKDARKRGLIDGYGDRSKAYSIIQKLSK